MNMFNDDIYLDMVDTSKINSARSAMSEADKLRQIDEFRMKQQLESPIYKKLEEQNVLISNQLKEMIEQNNLLNKQLEESKKTEELAKNESQKSKIFGYFSFAVGTMIGLAGLIVALVALFK